MLGVGFETTASTVAAALAQAHQEGLSNFLVYTLHKLTPPAMRAILDAGEVRVDAVLGPGHVTAITGWHAWDFLPRDYSAVRARVTEAFTLRRLSAKIIGEIESITTLTAAIASGMGATVLPESAARSLCGAANGWMARISTPSMSLSLSLNMSARGSLSPQAQAVKEILLSLVSRPSLENRELQLVS